MKNWQYFGILSVLITTLVSGCAVDPKENLIDFVERTEEDRDTQLELAEGTVVDVSGTFFFALRPVIAQALPLQFIATVEFEETDDGGTMDVTLQPLSLNVGETEAPSGTGWRPDSPSDHPDR